MVIGNLLVASYTQTGAARNPLVAFYRKVPFSAILESIAPPGVTAAAFDAILSLPFLGS
jgi:hypothetical protein